MEQFKGVNDSWLQISLELTSIPVFIDSYTVTLYSYYHIMMFIAII